MANPGARDHRDSNTGRQQRLRQWPQPSQQPTPPCSPPASTNSSSSHYGPQQHHGYDPKTASAAPYVPPASRRLGPEQQSERDVALELSLQYHCQLGDKRRQEQEQRRWRHSGAAVNPASDPHIPAGASATETGAVESPAPRHRPKPKPEPVRAATVYVRYNITFQDPGAAHLHVLASSHQHMCRECLPWSFKGPEATAADQGGGTGRGTVLEGAGQGEHSIKAGPLRGLSQIIDFGSAQQLMDHRVGVHNWCRECRFGFDSPADLRDHLRNSASHRKCHWCPPDAQTFGSDFSLAQHRVAVHHWCFECNAVFPTAGALVDHDILDHHMCSDCLEHYETPQGLMDHRRVHDEGWTECVGCFQVYRHASTMVLHLEASACPSGADFDWVFDSLLGWRYGGAYLRRDGIAGFRCPSCHAAFDSVSGLMRHAEELVCGETMDHPDRPLSELLTFLENQFV